MAYAISSRTHEKLHKLLMEHQGADGAADPHRKTIVIFDTGEYSGHFNPMVELVRELCSQGHTVHYFASEIVRERVEEVGAIFQPYDLSLDTQRNGDDHWSIRRETEKQVAALGFEVTEEQVAHPFFTQLPTALGLLERGLHERVKALGPDVIISDLLWSWSPMVSDLLDVPLVSVISCTYAEPKDMVKIFGLTELAAEASASPFIQAVEAKLVSKYGLINYTPATFLEHVSEFRITFTVPEFDVLAAEGMRKSPYVKCYGPSFPPLVGDGDEATLQEDLKGFPIEELKRLKQEGKTIVYCSMGTVAGQNLFKTSTVPVMQSMIDVYGSDPNVAVVLSVGPKIDMDTLPSMPSNFFMQRSVPQKTILGIADVFVSHMGNNSTNEAIFMGCPMVSIPNFGDQNMNAERAAKLGIAVHIRSPYAPKPVEDLTYVTPEVLKAAVDEIIHNPKYKAAARKYRDLARQRRSYFREQAANEIFAYADEWRLRSLAKSSYKNLRISHCSKPVSNIAGGSAHRIESH